jgi:uncharacterized repeat protein (TIGR01451 family)
VKRTIQILATHNSPDTTGGISFAETRGRALSYRVLIILLTTAHFLFAGIGTAQVRTQKKVGNAGQLQAQSTVPNQPTMPDYKTGEFTLEQAKNDLATKYRFERINPKTGPSYLPAGKIYDQDPAPGTPLRRDTIVTLYVSSGPPTVPAANPTADISVIKTLVKKREYLAGEPVQYTIVVSNAGPSVATNVQIDDTPTNLSFDNVSGECSILPCTIKSIEAGSSSEPINVTATITADGTFENLVRVEATESDPNLANNTDKDNGGIASSLADVFATERLETPGPFHARQNVQYAISVSNAGPSNATNIKIVEKRTNLTISEVTGACNEFPCMIAKLAPGEVVTIIVTAAIEREGSFANGANVSAAERDANPGNNNVPNIGGVATSAPPPPPYPSWWWIVVISIVGGLGIAGGGAYMIWHWLSSPSPVPTTPPPVSPQPPPLSPLPPVPAVNASVNLEPGRSSIDGLRMTGPQMHLRTGLELGASIFSGPLPIIRREVINE